MATRRDLAINSLEKVARRAIIAQAPTAEAIAELRRISADPTVLGIAAGRALGRWEAIPLFHSLGRDVANLLIEAGADPAIMASTAASTAHRLRTYLRRG